MYKRFVYLLISIGLFSFLHTFFSGCRLVDGQDPGLDILNGNSSLAFNSLVVEANCMVEVNAGDNFNCQPTITVNSENIAPNQLSWELSQINTCSWININSANGNLFGTAEIAQIGNCLLAFRVKQDRPKNENELPSAEIKSEEVKSEYALSITVKPPKLNVDFKNCLSLIGVGENFSCDISAANGVEGSAFNYELASNNFCAWAKVNSKTGVITGSPTTNHVGSCNLVALVRDNFGSVSSKEITVTIPAVTVKVTPVSCPSIGKVSNSYSCQLVGSVNLPDKNLVWSLGNDNSCSWINVNSITGIVTGTPSLAFSDKSCSLSVRATSSNGIAQGAFMTQIQVAKVSFTVAEESCSGSVNVNSNSTCSLKATTDMPSPQIVWAKEADNTCNFITVSPGSSNITISPSVNNVGTCKLSVSATLGGLVKAPFSKSINVPAVPISVSLASCANSLSSGASYNCMAAASSSVAGVSYNWSTTAQHTCTWLTIDVNSGILNGSATIEHTGNCTIGISAKLGNASEGIVNKVISVLVRKYTLNSLNDIPLGSQSLGGSAVAVDNNYVVVGAPGFVQGDGSTGKVLVYYRDTGQSVLTLKQIINPSTSKMKSFGYGVSIKGSLLVIGAPTSTNTMTSQGAVSVYELSGSSWNLAGVIWGTSSAPNGYFGASVSTDGFKILAATGHYNQPAAYVVQKNTSWILGEPLDFAAVGSSSGPERIKVALNGNQAIISDKKAGAGQHGEVHIFDYINSSFIKKANPLSGAASEGYGSSISFYKNWILVGAPLGNGGVGSAYLYEKDGSSNYSLKSILKPSGAKVGDSCGSSVALYEKTFDRILLGCPTAGSNGGSGSVYAFFHNPGTGAFDVESKIVNFAGKANDQFGANVAGSAGLVAIGASLFDLPNYTDSGSVFVYAESP